MSNGIRPPDVIYEMAIALVEDLILQRLKWPAIVARCIEAGFTQSAATCANWRAEVRRRWALQDAEERPSRRDEHREMLRQLYAVSFSSADYRNCTRVAAQLMILDGLQVPETINVTGTVAVQAMSPEQREAEIATLLKRRDDAMRGLSPVPPRGSVVH